MLVSNERSGTTEKLLYTFLFRNAPRWSRLIFLRMLRCRDGVAASEFAFLAPLLVLMYLGTVEISRAINIDRHFSSATAMTGELVARETELGGTKSEADANLAGILKSVEHSMAPYDTTDLKIAVISVKASSDDETDTKVEWSYSHNGMATPSKCSAYTLAPGVVGKGESVIVVESSYIFEAMFIKVVPALSGNITWTDKSFHSPRNSCVDYAGNQCLLDCDDS